MEIPIIPNIHQTVLVAAEKPEAFDMSDWHSCDTTHCRAGWVVHVAGVAGYALEKKTSPVFAAMQIYKASSKINVSPVRFFESNEVALADMRRCAKEESETDGQEEKPKTLKRLNTALKAAAKNGKPKKSRKEADPLTEAQRDNTPA